MLGGGFHNFLIRWQWCFAEIAQHCLAKSGINLFPPAIQHVVECLQPVLLTAGGHTGPGAAGFHHDRELRQHVGILVKNTGLDHHVNVGTDRAARHREAQHAGVGGGGGRVEGVIGHGLVEHIFDLAHLGGINIKRVAGALESVVHRAHVRLHGAGGHGSD